MTHDERMTPAEFKIIRELLGLTGDWLADHLGRTPRTVRHWEQGKYTIPEGVRAELQDLQRRTRDYVDQLVAHLSRSPDPVAYVYRTDEDYHAADPSSPFPASWHRMVIARVALEVPALSIVFSDARAGSRR
nr:MAG: transcriptional regulator [Mycolicibacterium hassiacum]